MGGVIAFLLLSGDLPFSAAGPITNQMASISKGAYSMKGRKWQGISSDAQDFVRGLLELEPSRRFAGTSALQHQWLLRRSSRKRELLVVEPFVVRGLREFAL